MAYKNWLNIRPDCVCIPLYITMETIIDKYIKSSFVVYVLTNQWFLTG